MIRAGEGARDVCGAPSFWDVHADVPTGREDESEARVDARRGMKLDVLGRPRARGVHGVGRDPRGAGIGRLRYHFRQRAACHVLDIRALGSALARVEDEHDAHRSRADVMLCGVVRHRARELGAGYATRRDNDLGAMRARADLSERRQSDEASQQY